MLFHKNNPKISVCIPVYNAEKTLFQCLQSVNQQTFTDIEIIIINDGSSGTDESNRNCKKIVKEFKKNSTIPLIYHEHSRNLGLLEARRTGVMCAKGDFIFNLDSDDMLTPDCLEVLYQQVSSITDNSLIIVHGQAVPFIQENLTATTSIEIAEILNVSEESILSTISKIKRVYDGNLENEQIKEGFLLKNNHNGYIWGKLISRKLYLKAFSYIPSVECTQNEDLLQYTWISILAKRYLGVCKPIYRYSLGNGISGLTKIESLDYWEKTCSSATAYEALFSSLMDHSEITLLPDELKYLKLSCRYSLYNSIQKLNHQVTPALKPQAREMLCEYWGEDFVQEMEEELKKNQSSES